MTDLFTDHTHIHVIASQVSPYAFVAAVMNGDDEHARVLLHTGENKVMIGGCPNCLKGLLGTLQTDEDMRKQCLAADWPLDVLDDLVRLTLTFGVCDAVGEAGYWKAPRVVLRAPEITDSTRDVVWEKLLLLRDLMASMKATKPMWALFQELLLDADIIRQPIIHLLDFDGTDIPPEVWTPPAEVQAADININ